LKLLEVLFAHSVNFSSLYSAENACGECLNTGVTFSSYSRWQWVFITVERMTI